MRRTLGGDADLPCLMIAALKGILAGGAFGMALACDIGITAAGGPAGRVGPSRAKLVVLMGGARHGAEQALTFGLFDAVDQADELMTRADALASYALAADRRHFAAIKKMIPASIPLD